MNTFLIVLFALCCVGECALVPFFLKYQWPGKCKKSLMFKMICSTLFVILGLLAMKIANNTSEYAKLIMWGLAMGWLGDLFLHIPVNKIYLSGIGLFAFLAGHIFYILAFCKGISIFAPDAKAVSWFEVLGVLLIVGVMAVFTIVKRVKAKIYMVIPVVMYAITISFMVVKAIHLCFQSWYWAMESEYIPVFIVVGLGAILFLLSDATLGMIMFCGYDGRKKLKCFNIGTYFAAQVLFASSIFVLCNVNYAQLF